jgi:branched-chain amino acid transport system permease protein
MLWQIILNGIVAGLAYALLATGFWLWYWPVRFINIAYLVPFVVSPYAAYCCVRADLGVLPGVAFGVLLGSLFGIVLQAGLFGPMRKRGAGPLVLVLASIGVYVVLQGIISILFGDAPQSLRLAAEPTIRVFGAGLTRIQLITVGVSLGTVVSCECLLRFSQPGKWLRAVASDSELAEIVGIHPGRMMLLAAAVSAFVAGMSGILFAYDTDLVPTMGFSLFLMGLTAMVIGGARSISGNLLGGIFLGLVQHVGIWRISSQWQDAITFAVLIVFLVFRPQGLLGRPLRKMGV